MTTPRHVSPDSSPNISPGAVTLQTYLDASPVPVFAIEASAALLTSAGFAEQPFDRAFSGVAGRHFVRHRGSLIAWQTGDAAVVTMPMRIAGAHTDSPGFRIKPRPESTVAGCTRLSVEVYGGPLLNSWLDRDLGIAGEVLLEGSNGLFIRRFMDSRPVARIPQLAIHLDRGVNDQGLKLDKQQHTQLLWGLTSSGSFRDYVADQVGVSPEAIRGWDLAPFDTAKALLTGPNSELVAAARLDDLLSCHAALQGLIAAEPSDEVLAVVVLVDHEEVGSTSATGANAHFVPQVIERIVHAHGGTRDGYLASLASGHALSLDMAHATHPNYPERHDPNHPVFLGGGPVIKTNAQQRYATSLHSIAPFLSACDEAGVPVQTFVSHSEMPCGSTIGPALAAQFGIDVVDVGVPQLAMHSARETCALPDHDLLIQALTTYLSHA